MLEESLRCLDLDRDGYNEIYSSDPGPKSYLPGFLF